MTVSNRRAQVNPRVDVSKPRTIGRVLLLILLVAFVPGLLVQGLLHWQRFNTEQTREMQAHRDVARAVAVAFRVAIEDVAHEAHAAGLAILRFTPEDHEATNRFLSAALKNSPAAAELAWLTLAGRVIAASNSSAMGEDRHSEEYLAELERERPWVLGSVKADRHTGAAIFTVSRLLDDEEGRPRGILTIAIDAEKFADTRLEIHRTPDAGFILFDKRGVAAFRRPHFPFPDWQKRDFSSEEYVSEALAGREAGGKLDLPMTGKSWFTARTPIPELGWVAGAGREYDKVMGPLWRDLYLGIGLSVLCFLISGGIALYHGRMILTDLRGLHDSVTASGKSQETAGQPRLQSIAELCAIASAFEAVTIRRTEVERALRESEDRYRRLFENLNSAVVLVEPIFDGDGRLVDLKYLMANPAVSKHLNKSPEELGGRLYSEVFHYPGPNPVFAIYEQVLSSGEPYKGEILLPALNRHYDIAVYRPAPGRLALLLSDITERKHAEVAASRAHQTIAELIERAPFGIYVVDSQFRIAIMNTGSQDGAFRNVRPVIGRDFVEAIRILWPEPVAVEIIGHFRHTLDTGEPYYSPRFVNPRHDVSIVESYEWELHRMPLSDGRFGVICYYYDSTDLRRAEEALRASLHEKEVMLSEIHHRVKNNMQVISSLVALQAEHLPDEAVRAVLKDVTHRVRSMALVHEKLYRSADLTQIDFADYVRSLLGYLWRAHETDSSHVRLILDLEPITLSVDAAVPCGLILNELVSNALRHAFEAGIEGEVAVSLQSCAQDQVRLCVRDNGRGLPAGFDWKATPSLGLRLIRLLAGQLRAVVEVSGDRGTEISVAFKVRNGQ
ncbi:MAG: sensor histidine kinase [Syntrophobacteraceae bacterium]